MASNFERPMSRLPLEQAVTLPHLDDYRHLAETIPQMVYAARPDGSLEYFNRAWYAYTGQTPEEALDFGWSDVVHSDDLAKTSTGWLESMATGTSFDAAFRLRRHDGVFRWFVGRGEPVRGDAGRIVRWYGGCTDVDDLKLAEAALRESGHSFHRLAHSLPQIVWMTDAAGTNTFLNHRWHHYTGVDPLAPHSLAAVTHPDDYERAMVSWRHSLASGELFETEYRLRRADGAYRWFLGRAIAVRGANDEIVEWFGSCTDIEDQKRAQAEVRIAYERERRIAMTLQGAFLTEHLPSVAGFAFDAVYRPADNEAEIGGDWYDAIELDDGRVVISIGDVAGHGLDAAVVMGKLRQTIRAVARIVDFDPVAILDATDRSLRCEAADTICTAFVGVLDPRSQTLSFASAGHPPPLLRSNETIVELRGRGLPLGLRRPGEGRGDSLALPQTGMLVLYTDGLIESTRDLEAGERRLRDALGAVDDTTGAPARYIAERVLANGARDDVAILAVTIGELPRPDTVREPPAAGR
jgi:PAS domain S-box-containing protein